MSGEKGFSQMMKGKDLAAAQNGSGEAVHFRGREDEDHVARWFLERLQKSVEGAFGEHVRFVNDENFVTPLHRGIADFFPEGPGVIHGVVGGAVDFDNVRMNARRNFPALLAFIARFGRGGVGAVERLGEDPGNGGLADAACAAEEVAGGDAVFGAGSGEDLLDHILPHDLGKGLGAVTGGEGSMLHVRKKGACFPSAESMPCHC